MFVVGRVWNGHGDMDFLAGWCERWGTVCTGRKAALTFATEAEALAAAARARELVPAFKYRVLPRAEVVR